MFVKLLAALATAIGLIALGFWFSATINTGPTLAGDDSEEPLINSEEMSNANPENDSDNHDGSPITLSPPKSASPVSPSSRRSASPANPSSSRSASSLSSPGSS